MFFWFPAPFLMNGTVSVDFPFPNEARRFGISQRHLVEVAKMSQAQGLHPKW